MARAHPRLSPEAKAAKKEKAAADKAAALAANALAKIPEEKERRDELWRELDALVAEGQGVAGQISHQKKRMTEVFGITKPAMAIRKILNKCRDGEYEATVEQVALFMRDTNRPFQLSMKLEPGKGVAEDEGSVFDKTNAGEHVGAERSDDPGRASKRRGPPAPPATATPNVGVEGLAAGIKPKESSEEKRAKINDQKSADAAVFDKVAGKETPKKDSPAAKVEAMDADTKNMTPAQKRAHAKKIADEVFARQGNNGLGPDAIH